MKAIHCYENKNKRYVTAAGKAIQYDGVTSRRRQPLLPVGDKVWMAS